MISGHAMFLAVNQFALCIKNEWKQCSFFSPPATVILLLFLTFEALLFAVFTLIMLGTQINAIWNDETVGVFFFFLWILFVPNFSTNGNVLVDIFQIFNKRKFPFSTFSQIL